MDVLKLFGAALLLIGFIYFILIRAISINNYIRKSFYLFISGIIITLFLTGGIIYDVINNNFDMMKNDIRYYSFLIVSVVLMIVIPLIYYIKGNKRKQKFKNSFKKEKAVPTIKDKKEYVYIILKYNNSFYLQKKSDKEIITYQNEIIKFGHNDYFHDDVVKQHILKNNLDIISYKYIGKAIKCEKKDNIYYCYRILLNSLPDDFNNYELIDPYRVLSINLSEEHKKILFTSVVEDDFNIQIK